MKKRSLVTLALVLAGCGSPEGPVEETVPSLGAQSGRTPLALTSTQQTGRVIYETMCWTCHGNAGRGDGPAVKNQAASVTRGDIPTPPSFQADSYAMASAASLQDRFRVGLEGADTGHPHMQYVASLLRPESFTAALSFIPVVAYPPEIPGSVLAGQALYQGRCTACHGESGRGDGAAASSLVLMQPADFTADTLLAARDWEAVFARIREGGSQVHGSSMPPWEIVLSEGETWDLVSYLATFQSGLLSDPPWSD